MEWATKDLDYIKEYVEYLNNSYYDRAESFDVDSVLHDTGGTRLGRVHWSTTEQQYVFAPDA
jgi:hypothetical protein